ncbi:phosphatidylethanolamine-binding protein 4 isoform X2 [Empidonax traillii]|uniref:phosphatidylethanolamine-binding protein 4 isoform X1 n=1 Tax=Empidonax traillii TaxID=164674 RepID=UPI000FFD52AE|nr:phosphatidylethanolamine-binding protein 4 isoform X1 [Empidonax traillii]XP_027762761.1 phosphatidylethanolamine-binding protein 4 isoform X2 [Empidonax traillii]XP_027762762.1 phosphatidylethanolamine-binding protein 4 isoform X2 [Empidonax traillii]
MRLLSAVLVALSLFLTGVRGNNTSRTCIFQTLNDSDKVFCKGELEVIYPNVGDVSCSYIPKCHGYRRQISRDWGSPHVRYPWAEKNKKYVLVMVDPDAPNRANPRHRYWRHWLVTNILGADLRVGKVKGRVLSGYVRPSPPPHSGYHRYQVRLYAQPAHEHISLSPEEDASLGSWDLKGFVEDFGLGYPVAKTQFLTKYYED